MTAFCLLALAIACPACAFLAWQMWRLSRELNRDQKNGYRLPPKWMEGDK